MNVCPWYSGRFSSSVAFMSHFRVLCNKRGRAHLFYGCSRFTRHQFSLLRCHCAIKSTVFLLKFTQGDSIGTEFINLSKQVQFLEKKKKSKRIHTMSSDLDNNKVYSRFYYTFPASKKFVYFVVQGYIPYIN